MIRRPKRCLELEVLDEVEIQLESDTVGKPDQIAAKSLVVLANRLPAPVHLAQLEIEQSGDSPQQARLAATIRPLHRKEFARIQRKIERLEQAAITA